MNSVKIESIDSKAVKLFRKLYDKILESCSSKIAPYLLGVLSFTESCCFIIPPEVMLLPMGYANRKKAFRYALITTVTSVFGAIAGYFIGQYFWEVLGPFANTYIPGFAKYFDIVKMKYANNAELTLFLAAFTPIPFKVFTVVAGVFSDQISLTLLVTMSIIGRGIRYYLLSALVYFLGPKAHEVIEKHFKKFTIIVGVVAIILALILKLRHS